MRYSIILIAILLLSSCDNIKINNDVIYKPINNAPPNQLRLLGHWLDEGKKEQLFHETINEFEFTHQDIKITLDYLEKMSQQKLISDNYSSFNAQQIISENPDFDILKVNNDFSSISKFLPEKDYIRKYLVDFSEIEEFRNNTRPELLTDKVKAQYGGIIPGPFIDGYNWPLWCNNDLAAKIGVKVKQFDMSFEDFLTYIAAVNDYNKQHNDSIVPLFEASTFPTAHTIAEMLFFSEVANYDEIMDVNYSTKKINAWSKVAKDLERLGKYKPLPNNWRKLVWADHLNSPIEDKCLFYINGSWMYNIWLKKDSSQIKKMMPCELPVYKTAPLCFGGYNMTWVVPKKAKNRDNAVKFLLYMNSLDFVEKWTRYTKSPSGVKGKLTSLNFGTDKFENFQVMTDNKYQGKKIDLLWGSAFCFGNINSNVDNLSVEIISGEMTAEKAISSIKSKLKTH